MKRLNLIIGKKHLVIASLTLLVGAAAAVSFAAQSGKNDSAKSAEQVGSALESGGKQSALKSSDDYFAGARLEKQQARDEAAQVLAVMYQGGDMTDDELGTVAANAKNLSAVIESENAVETMLKAQGFEDALCYISDSGANIIVKTEGLDAAGAAKIKSALLSEVEVASENITIVEVR